MSILPISTYLNLCCSCGIFNDTDRNFNLGVVALAALGADVPVVFLAAVAVDAGGDREYKTDKLLK